MIFYFIFVVFNLIGQGSSQSFKLWFILWNITALPTMVTTWYYHTQVLAFSMKQTSVLLKRSHIKKETGTGFQPKSINMILSQNEHFYLNIKYPTRHRINSATRDNKLFNCEWAFVGQYHCVMFWGKVKTFSSLTGLIFSKCSTL